MGDSGNRLDPELGAREDRMLFRKVIPRILKKVGHDPLDLADFNGHSAYLRKVVLLGDLIKRFRQIKNDSHLMHMSEKPLYKIFGSGISVFH